MVHFLLDTGETISFIGVLTVNMESPLLSELNTYTIPGTIPFTSENSRKLGRPELINSSDNKQRQFECMFIAGSLQLKGVLRISEASDSGYKFNFTGQGAFWNKTSGEKLNEQQFDEIDYPTDLTTKTFSLTDPDDFIYKANGRNAIVFIPHFNTNYYKSTSYYNESNDIRNVPINDYYIPVETYPDRRRYNSNTPPSNPWLFLNYIVEVICSKNNYSILQNDITKYFEKLLVYNNYNNEVLSFVELEDTFSITEIEVADEDTLKIILSESHSLTTASFVKLNNLSIDNSADINNRIFKVDDVPENNSFQIKYDTSNLADVSGSLGEILVMQHVYTNTAKLETGRHMPSMSQKDFIKELYNSLSIVAIPSESAANISFRLMKDIILAKDFEDISKYAGKIKPKPLQTETGYNIKFAPILDEYLEERFKELEEKHTLKEAVQRLSDLPILGNNNNDVRRVVEEQCFYIWEASEFGSREIDPSTDKNLGAWKFFSLWSSVINGDGSYTHELKAASLPSFKHYQYGWGRTLPRIDHPCNSEFTNEATDCGMRFTFFRNDNGYPLATNTNGIINLNLEGENGLHELLWKDVLEWKINRARDFKSAIQWPRYMLNSFPWDKKFRINGTNFLIKKIPFNVYSNGNIVFKETELVRT